MITSELVNTPQVHTHQLRVEVGGSAVISLRKQVNTPCFSASSPISHTYDQVTNDDRGQEERYARDIAHEHTVPHRLDPFSAQHTENDHERVHEVGEVPSG